SLMRMAAMVVAGAFVMVALAVIAMTMDRHGHAGLMVPAAMVGPAAMMAPTATAMVAGAGVMAADVVRHRGGRDSMPEPEAGIQGQALLETIHGRAELPSLTHVLGSPESWSFVARSPGRPRQTSVSGA